MSSARPILRRVAAAGLGLSLLAALPAVPAAAHGTGWNPVYHVTVTPTAAAGRSVTTKVVLTMIEDTHHPEHDLIGSLRVTPPAGFTLTAATAKRGMKPVAVSIAGGVATANNLNLRTAGQKVRFTLTSTVRCGTVGTARWTIGGNEAAIYTDPGRTNFARDKASSLRTTVAGCSLDFLRQPALSGTGTSITSVAADPAAANVAVRLLDGKGQPSSQSGIPVTIAIADGTGANGASLGGSTSDATNGNGVAGFAPTIDKPGRGYRLTADAGAGITGATSSPFDIAGVAVTCSGTCTGSQQKGGTTASIAADTNGGLLALTLGLEDVDCDNEANHYYQASSEPLVFDVTSGTGRTVVTVRIDAANVDRRLSRYKVCFSSPVSTFENRYGTTIGPGEAGILPDCWDDDDTWTSVAPAHDEPHPPVPVDHQACFEKRWKDEDGNVYVRFSVPPGDPRAKI